MSAQGKPLAPPLGTLFPLLGSDVRSPQTHVIGCGLLNGAIVEFLEVDVKLDNSLPVRAARRAGDPSPRHTDTLTGEAAGGPGPLAGASHMSTAMNSEVQAEAQRAALPGPSGPWGHKEHLCPASLLWAPDPSGLPSPSPGRPAHTQALYRVLSLVPSSGHPGHRKLLKWASPLHLVVLGRAMLSCTSRLLPRHLCRLLV